MRMVKLLFAGLVTLVFAGCATEKIPVEDPIVFTEYAKEIAVLRDPMLTSNSEEKFKAAEFIADNVDFSFTRNVATLDKLFLASEAATNGVEIVFQYAYQDRIIQFRFRRYDNIILFAEVVKK